jgi:glycosyltransferase involved in cell wall biosynthesis
VVPYQPQGYRIKASGIVWEAIANGTPLVAPDKTAPGNLIASLGCGRLFGEPSTESILGAIRTVHADYRIVSSLAHVAARRWADRHGIQPFVDRLLSAENR